MEYHANVLALLLQFLVIVVSKWCIFSLLVIVAVRLQNGKVIKKIVNSLLIAHITPVLNFLRWLPVKFKIDFTESYFINV